MSGTPAKQPLTAPATWLVLCVNGEVDLATSPDLCLLLEAVPDDAGDVIVDLTGVSFMDCSALPPLLRARTRFGDRLWLRGPGPLVLRLLEVTDLDHLFNIIGPTLIASDPPPPEKSTTPKITRIRAATRHLRDVSQVSRLVPRQPPIQLDAGGQSRR
jgi:anti-sigma B factor antagonist